jgi:hypothetical protein
MSILRRILGLLVMVAGLLGLVIALAGLVGLWRVKPTVVASVSNTVSTLEGSITTSQEVMTVTKSALGATVTSLEALSDMLASTAGTVEGTEPIFADVNTLMGESLPTIMGSATDSLQTAQQAAVVLDSTIRNLEAFQFLLSDVPLLTGFVEEADLPQQAYNPEVSMAESLGEIATTLDELPPMFESMAANMDTADDNLESVRSSLVVMSDNVVLISGSIAEYESMVAQSQSSMDNLRPILAGLRTNLPAIVDGITIGLTLFLSWLLVIQIVVFTQGWELFQGTAGRMEGGAGAEAAEG